MSANIAASSLSLIQDFCWIPSIRYDLIIQAKQKVAAMTAGHHALHHPTIKLN